MAIGTAIGIPFKRAGQSWSSYWTSRSLFFLDGTIITVGADKYFKDRSSAARNFLITGYDFDSTWTKGFPYKSAATISAPAGDAVLIAADINNFLYDAGGTPNAIPVVSLFQNVDYLNLMYCRHVAQTIDGNGVELTEPYVAEIFMVDGTLSAVDLVKAATYFGVTTKDATAKWVAADGNDVTGDGSEALPYLTAMKAATVINTGLVAYLKTQLYDDETGGYIYDQNNNKLKAIGRALVNNINTSYGVRTSDNDPTLFQRFYLASNAPNYPMYLASTALDLKDIFILTDACARAVYGVFKDMINCIVKSTGTLTSGVETTTSANDRTIEDCLIEVIATTGLNIASGAYGTVTIKNNKFKTTATQVIGVVMTSGTCNIKGNKIIPVSMTNGIVFNAVGTISYNEITMPGGRAIVLSGTNEIVVTNNTIDAILAPVTTDVIFASWCPCEIKNNIINSGTALKTSGSDIGESNNNAAAVSYVKINNNKCICLKTANYHIRIGEESTGAGDNKITTIEIQKNYVKGSQALGGAYGTNHGLFVGFQINAFIRYNYVWGSAYGIVIKGSVGTIYTANGCSYNIIRESPQGILVKGAQSVTINNNTIINKTTDFTWVISLNHNIGAGTDPADNCIVKNNIIIALGAGINNMITLGAGANNDIDYNIYYCPNGTPLWGGVNWATWQALGYDAHSIVLNDVQYNALFNDISNNDYSLKTGSVAIGAGVTLDAAYDDGLDASSDWGADTELPTIVTKQQGASWDIGAYIH